MNIQPFIQAGMRRIFIGIPVDECARISINELLEPIENTSPDIRWVPESNWHITLAFLGNKPISEVERLLQLPDDIYQQQNSFQYNLSAFTRFPDPAGSIIALVGDPGGPLHRLFQITLDTLQRNRIEFDRKEFQPHITLGRIKKPKYLKTAFDQRIRINLEITKIIVYQSTLTESGSIYSSLKEIRLN